MDLIKAKWGREKGKIAMNKTFRLENAVTTRSQFLGKILNLEKERGV